MSRLRLLIVLGLLASTITTAFAAATATATAAASSKISPDAAAAPAGSTVPVIIQYKQPPSSLETLLISLLGGIVNSTLGTIDALVADVPQTGLNQIAADSNVTYISLNRAVGARQEVSITAAEYTTQPINAPAVWQKGYVGTNVGVALIDSGVTPVPDLGINQLSLLPPDQPLVLQLLSLPNEVAPWMNGRIVYSQNFVAGQNDALDARGRPDRRKRRAFHRHAGFPDVLWCSSECQYHQPPRSR